MTSQRTPCSLREMPRTTTVFAQRPLCAPTELLLPCRRPYCKAMVTLRRPLCALLGCSIRMPSERRATVFVLSMLKVRAVARRSMQSQGVQWRCHCVAAVMLAFVLCAPWRSAFFLGRRWIAVGTPPWCDRGFRD